MFLSEDEVRELLPMQELIPVIAKALSDLSSGKVIQPVRTVLPIAEHSGFFGVMPAVRLCANTHPPSPSVGSGQWLNVGKLPGPGVSNKRAQVFGPRPHPHESCRKSAERRKPLKQPDDQWKRIAAFGFASRDNVAVNKGLHRLDNTGGPFPSPLYLLKVSYGDWAEF
jgi:hypothetical protein